LTAESKTNSPLRPQDWVDQHGDYLFRYAMLRLNNDTQLAEDLVQETFLAAIKAIATYQGNSAERTWLVSILKNKIIDHYRRKKSNLFEQSDFQNEEFINQGEPAGAWKVEFAPQDWGDTPEKAFEQQEFTFIFRKCLAALPQNLAAVFALRELDGLDTDTICKELSISASNVWVILHRARTSLRRCLELNWFEASQ